MIECQGNNYKEWTKCNGTYKSETGLRYKGLFVNGSIVKGNSIYPGGAKYIGEFKNFQPHGFGTFIWSNGDKYYGEWRQLKNAEVKIFISQKNSTVGDIEGNFKILKKSYNIAISKNCDLFLFMLGKQYG